MSDPGPANMGEREEAFIGRTISERYRIDALIASGGMGAVFRGQHLHMRKRVAIKILHAEIEGVLELAEQFEREAIAGAHISHPNVAIATDFGRLDDGSFFLIQEYLRGETLADVLEQGPLSADRALHIAKQVAGALQAVHEMKIVHRDVKPSNVMLIQDTEDEAKLIDFGFARVPMERMSVARADDPLHDKDGMWDPDTMFGTVGYLAPEAVEGVDAIDGRSDLYALGASMYEMFTGKPPFEAPTTAELFQLHSSQPPPAFFERAPLRQVPASVEGVVMRLLAKDPAERYQSGEEVIAALDRVVVGKPGAFPQERRVDLGDLEIPPEPASRMWWLLGAIVLLTAVGGVAWMVPSVGDQFRQWGIPIPAPATGSAVEAEPEPSATAAPKEVDQLGAAAWTARLLAAPKSRDWKGGAKALAALALLDPTALRTDAVAEAATAVAIGATRLPADGQIATEIFDLLAERFASDGLDVLYHIVETKPPKDPAAKRAATLLAQPEILGRATLALRIVLDLRQAPCDKKAALFERAVADGDPRALKVLKLLRVRPCQRTQDPCCFRTNQALAKAISALDARLKRP